MKPHIETYHCPWCGGLAFSSGPIQNGVFHEAVFCFRCGKPFSMLGRYERGTDAASEPDQQGAGEGHVMYERGDTGEILRYALKQVPAGKIITSNGKTYRGGMWVSEKLIGQAVDAPAKAGKPAKKAADAPAGKAPGKKATASYHETVKAKASAKKPSAKKPEPLATKPEPASIDNLLAPHAGIELSPKERGNVKRSLAALKRHHGDNVVKRIAELATAAHQAMEAATGEPAKAKLAKKLREYGEMMAAVRGESVKAGQLNEAAAELKPDAEETKQPEPETPRDAGEKPSPDVETIKKYIDLADLGDNDPPTMTKKEKLARADEKAKIESEHPGIKELAEKLADEERKFTPGEPQERTKPLTIKQIAKSNDNGNVRFPSAISGAKKTGWITDGRILVKLSDAEKQSVATMESDDLARSPNIQPVIDRAKADNTTPAKIVGYRESEMHDAIWPRYAIGADGIRPFMMNATLYETISKRFPDAKPFVVGKNQQTPTVAFKTDDGEVVGVAVGLLDNRGKGPANNVKFKDDDDSGAAAETEAKPVAEKPSPEKAEWYAIAVGKDGKGVMVKCDSKEEASEESDRLKLSQAKSIVVGKTTSSEAKEWLSKKGVTHVAERGPGTMQVPPPPSPAVTYSEIIKKKKADVDLKKKADEPVVAESPVATPTTVPPASAFDDLLFQLRTENPGKAIAIRVGDFYEFHGDDATRAATALHTDAKDRKNLVTGITSPVLAIPHQAIDKMLTHLERAGVDVAVADLEAEMAGDAEPVVEPVPVAAPVAEPPVAPLAEPPAPPAKTDAEHEQDYNAIRAQHNAEIARSHADWIATEKSFQVRARGVGKNTQKYAKINEEYLDAKQQSENARTAMNRKFYKELESHPFEAIRRQRDQDAMKAKHEAEDRSRKERIAQRAAEAKAAIASAQGTTKMQVVDAWFPTFIANREKGGALASEPMSADEQEVFKANLLDSLSNLDKMIESKDVKLGGMLHTRNPMFRDYFAAVTGIGLPKTEKGTTEALNAFIGQAKIDAIAAAKQAERQAKIDAAAKAKADARAALDAKYHGYTASMAPYMAATVDKNLSKPVRADGVNYASIRDFVESKLRAGYRVDNGRFKQADGRYFDAAGIGASAINYAAYRSGQIQKAEAVAKEVAAPETAKAPPVSQPLPPPVAPIKPITASTANRNDSFAQSVRDSVKLPPATPTPTFTWVDQQSAATDPAAQAARTATLKALRLNGFIANKYPFYRDGKSIRIGEGWVKTGPTDNWDSFTNEEAVAELNRITQEQAENFNRRGSPLRYAHGINN